MKKLTDAEIADKFLALPPAEWAQAMCYAWAPQQNSGAYQDVCRVLEARVQRCAMLGAYLEERSGATGCGLKSHEEGVKAAGKVLVRIRKALGFSYPKAGAFTF